MPKDDGYSAQEMRDWLKSRGYNLDTGSKTAAPTTVPGGSAGASTTGETGDEEMGTGTSLARGLAKSAASTGIGAARLAGQLLPTTVRRTLGQLAESQPIIKKSEEFAKEDYRNIPEGVGGFAGDVATGLMMPEIGLPKIAAKMVPATKYAGTQPVWVNPLGQGGRWMLQNVTKSVVNPKSVERAKLAGQVVENAAKGAVGGAATNPDDPVTGAAYGAGGGLAQRGLAQALQHRYGKDLGDLLFRYVPASILGGLVGHYMGGHGTEGALGLVGTQMVHGLAHTARGAVGYHHQGIGGAAGRAGRATFDKAGKFLGYVDPVTGGILTERARETVSSDKIPSDVSDWWERNVSSNSQNAAPGQSIFSSEDHGPARPAHEQPYPNQ